LLFEAAGVQGEHPILETPFSKATIFK